MSIRGDCGCRSWIGGTSSESSAPQRRAPARYGSRFSVRMRARAGRPVRTIDRRAAATCPSALDRFQPATALRLSYLSRVAVHVCLLSVRRANIARGFDRVASRVMDITMPFVSRWHSGRAASGPVCRTVSFINSREK